MKGERELWLEMRVEELERELSLEHASGVQCEATVRRAAAAEAKLARCVGALEEITEGVGAFSRDPLTHAANCIEAMKATARAALAAAKGGVMVLPISDKEYIAELEEERNGWRRDTIALREENARLKDSQRDWHDMAVRRGEELDALTRERDEARAEAKKALAAGMEASILYNKATDEVARLEGLILDWAALPVTASPEVVGFSDAMMIVEARRIRAQREEGR